MVRMELPKNVIAIAIGITLLLTALVLLHFRAISGRTGSLVIPAGNTYLGPNTPAPQQPEGAWREVHGRIYPYIFSVPTSLKLTTFPDDTYDIYAIDCCGIAPGSNVLVGVDYKADPKTSKLAYVQNWWKQFSGLKSVSSIDQFTSSKGLKGYKAKYVNSAGDTPNIDVFFEVPGNPEYVIHLASGTVDSSVFAKIVDSVGWQK